MCWVCFLLLKVFVLESKFENYEENFGKFIIWDLWEGVDLVWLICLFREVIDIEFIFFLIELEFLDS